MEEFELKLAENTALLQRLIETAKAKLKSRPKPPQSPPPPFPRFYNERQRQEYARLNRMPLKMPSRPPGAFQEPPNQVPKKIREESEFLAAMIHNSAQRADYYVTAVEDYTKVTKKIAANKEALLGQIKARVRKEKIAEAKNLWYDTSPTPKPPDTQPVSTVSGKR